MSQFVFTLKDTTRKAFNSFFWFMYFLHVTAAAVIILNTTDPLQKKYAIAGFTLFVILTAVFYLLKNKFKLYSYQLLMFVVMMFFWPLQSAWLPLIIVVAVIAFALMVRKTKSTALFTAAGVVITRSLFKKQFSWQALQNVVLKDGLLSVDLTNNHLIQVEIEKQDPAVDEQQFNAFCKAQLK